MRNFVAVLGTLIVVTLSAGGLRAEPISTEDALADKVMGSADAPIEIIAYESMTCPHCASFHQNAWHDIKAQYIDTGKARFILRDFPFDAVGLRAAMLARCTGDKRYYGVVEILFKSQTQWARAEDPMQALAGIGRLAGLSAADFDACMANQALMDGILVGRQTAEREFDVSSTPSFIINGIKVVGAQPFEEFDKVLAPMAE